MSKRGKEIKMKLSENYNVVFGTVDNKQTNVIYTNISAWGTPIYNGELTYSSLIGRLNKIIKQTTYNYLIENNHNNISKDRTIVDLDMRESGVRVGKYSYMNCEITIYQNQTNTSIDDEKNNKLLSNITNVVTRALDNSGYFKFVKNKK